jgi:hypothetical protein
MKSHKCRERHVFWVVLRLEGAGFEVKSLLELFMVSFLFENFCQFSSGPLIINFRSLLAIFAGLLRLQMLNSLLHNTVHVFSQFTRVALLIIFLPVTMTLFA